MDTPVKAKPKMKLYGFNNLTKTLSFNIYDICYTRTEEEKKQYIQYIDEVYNADRLTAILTEVSHIIGANILNVAKQDYDPQGASVTILISEEEIEKEDVVMHLDKSHLTVHTYPESHPHKGISTFRADIEVSTCGQISPLNALNYLIQSFDSDILTLDYHVRGFTRDVSGKKIYIDHRINSIQNYISAKTRNMYNMIDVNVYQENIFHTKMMLKEFDLDMKPLYCEYTIDSSKIIFYYCADDRVDFRELLKVLAPKFRIRVELRQIGTREAARVIGGIGSCGRELCCKTHLVNFDFVTMKMAKEQGMSLNTSKISGICDKLMCCIAYEHELYKELKKEMPSVGQMVKTPTCDCCKVVSVDYLKKMVKTNENPNGAPTSHNASEVEVINFNKEVKDESKLVATIEDEVIEIADDNTNTPDEYETASIEKEEPKTTNNNHQRKYHNKGKQNSGKGKR